MPIPRFRDADSDYEIVLACKCGWAITKDEVTQDWKQCRLCGGKLETRRVDYAENPYSYSRKKEW